MKTELRLSIGCPYGVTDITDVYFTSPLKIGTPAGDNDRLNIVFMMASAGILKGDYLDFDIYCGENTRARITDQSYTKIFNTRDGSAGRRQKIAVDEGASLFYCPLGIIPFKGSRFDASTEIYLKKDSEFLMRDIWAAGRIGMGEAFEFTHYRNRTLVCMDDRPIYMDHCFLEPERMNLNNLVFMDGMTHQGTFYYYGPENRQQKVLDFTPSEYFPDTSVFWGVSRATAGVGIRVLARAAGDIECLFDALEEILNKETD